MSRTWLVLEVLMMGSAWAQAPAYTADQIVNASNYTPGPFAPNSVLAVFGTNLSWRTHALDSSDIAADTLPTQMAGVAVYVDDWPAPLLYVSGTQINFIVPGNQISGDVRVRVTREGVSGPPVTVPLAEVAPALFDIGTGYAIATHADGALLTAGSPGKPGEIVVIYLTGLGRTEPNPSPGEIPQYAAPMLHLSDLSVSLDGAVLPWFRIKYAGVTPWCGGLYQINLELPQDVRPDPRIRVAAGTMASPELKLAVD